MEKCKCVKNESLSVCERYVKGSEEEENRRCEKEQKH